MYLSRDRFKEISKCLHFYDNEKAKESSDKFIKVFPLVECFNNTFSSVYELGRHVAYDEATIASLSRYMPSKVYNCNKPHKWGVKMHMVNCSTTGFCTKFEIYKGKMDATGKVNVDKSGPSSLLRNVKHLAHSNRIIYCDRFYTCLSLFIQLRSIGLYACGTIMPNRVGFPSAIKMYKKEKLSRGTVRQATTNYKYRKIWNLICTFLARYQASTFC